MEPSDTEEAAVMVNEAVSLSQLRKAELVELVLQLRGKEMGRASETDTTTTPTPDPGIQEMLTQQENFQRKDCCGVLSEVRE